MTASTYVNSTGARYTGLTMGSGISLTPVAGRDLILLLFTLSNAGAPTSVVSSVGATVITDVPYDGTLGVYRVHGTTAVSQTIDATFGANVNGFAWLVEASNVGQFDQRTVAASGSSAAFLTNSITPSQAGALLLAVGGCNSSATFSAWTNSFAPLVTNDHVGPTIYGAYLDQSVEAAVAAGATISASESWKGLLVSFVPTSTAPTITGLNAPVSPPSGVAVITAATGGTLGPNLQRFYEVTAINAYGETVASLEVNVTTGSSGSTNANTVSWNAAAGATGGYRVYATPLYSGYTPASGGEAIYFPVAAGITSFTDTGRSIYYGIPPATNSTAAPIDEGATGVPLTGAHFDSSLTANIQQPGGVSVAQTATYTDAGDATISVIMEPGTGNQLAFSDSTYPTTLTVGTTSAGPSQPYQPVILTPPAGLIFTTLASVNPNGIQASPALVVGDQIEASGDVNGGSAAPAGLQLNSDGTFQWASGSTPANFYVRVYDSANKVWGAWALQTVTGGVVTITVPTGLIHALQQFFSLLPG
jgi:hypothetical protein